MNYTTRSAIDVGFECERKRYYMTFFEGIGITPIGEAIPLLTGSTIHLGIESCANGEEVDVAVAKARHYMNQEVMTRGLQGHTKDQTDYTLHEQANLAEGLIRGWYSRERNKLLSRFRILSVEKEHKLLIAKEHQLPLTKDIVMLSKPDQVLQDKESGDIYNYSIKSIKKWYERMDNAYKVDLQGITEAIAVTVCEKATVLGTKFCYLVKGDRRKGVEVRMINGQMVEEELYVTSSPLIYAYRMLDRETQKFRYAHSNLTIKPENKSGYGRLSKDWQRFRVWETKGGVKKWLEILNTGRIQPELGDVVKQQIITPPEVHRTREQLKSTLVQIQHKEARMFQGRDAVLNGDSIDKWFPMNRRSCYFPSECEYLKICPVGGHSYDANISSDPLGSGEFVKRVPHYKTEREAL